MGVSKSPLSHGEAECLPSASCSLDGQSFPVMMCNTVQGTSGPLPFLEANTSPTYVADMCSAWRPDAWPSLGSCLEFYPHLAGAICFVYQRSLGRDMRRDLASLQALSGAQSHVKVMGFCSRKELGRQEEEGVPMTLFGCHRNPQAGWQDWVGHMRFWEPHSECSQRDDSSSTRLLAKPWLEDTAPHSAPLLAHLCIPSIFIADHFVRELSTKQALLLRCAPCAAEV